MARQLHEILGLLGAAQASAVQVYPLDPGPVVIQLGPPGTEPGSEVAVRVQAWASVWGADFGRMTAAVTQVEKDVLVAAGACERATRD